MPRRAVVLFAAVLMSGCGREAETWKAQAAAIQGGELDAVDRAAVGIVAHLATQPITCSGVLIAPSVVATARHCVVAQLDGPIVCGQAPLGDTYPSSSIEVTTALTSDNSLPSDAGARHTVREIRVVPGGNDVCGFDFALLVLSDVVAADEATPLEPRFTPPLRDGEIYGAIGYGATCGDLVNDERCRIESGARRRIDNLSVQCAETCPAGDFAATSEWLGDRGLCQGDSGGPAIDEDGALIGVALRGGTDAMGNCVGSIFLRVDAWRDFLVGTVREIAAQTGAAAPSWAQDRIDASPKSDAADSTAVEASEARDEGSDANPDALAEEDQSPDACRTGAACTEAPPPGQRVFAGGGCNVVVREPVVPTWQGAAILLGLATIASVRRRNPKACRCSRDGEVLARGSRPQEARC